jgi:hypothetical protein
MVRKYLLFGLLTLLFTASAFSQYKQTGGYSRILGMGNNPYIIDPYVATVNPAWGSYYPNFLFGDLGGPTNTYLASPWGPGGTGQFISANFHVGGGLTLGAMLTRNDFNGFSIGTLDPFGIANQLNGVFEQNVVIGLNNNLELMGAYKSGNTAFGLGIAYASTNNESTPAGGSTSSASAMQLGFNAGIITKITNSMMLDLGVSFMMPSAKIEPAGVTESKISQTIIGANARLFIQHSSKLSFVPSVVFLTTSGTLDNGTVTPATSRDLPSNMLIGVGLGANYEVGDFLLAGGPAFALASSTTSAVTDVSPELKNSAFIFPVWNLGVEWNMTDWFVARFGYVAATASITNENTATPTTINELVWTQYAPLGATVGVGFRLGNFSLDAVVNEDVLRQGLNNLGGNGPGAATFAYLSLGYAMP